MRNILHSLDDCGAIKSTLILILHFIGKYNWKEGFISGAIYYYDEELIKLLTQVYGLASYTNPLHCDIFPGICKMEAEVVRLVANLFHGDSNTCGTVFCKGAKQFIFY